MASEHSDDLEKLTEENKVFYSPCQFSEHNKTSSLQTLSTDSSPEISPYHETSLSKFKFCENPLNPNRFQSSIPPHFLCPMCKSVVLSPQECKTCETLICYNCLPSACPVCRKTTTFKEPAKFALKIYESLKITCKNKPIGCPFEDTISKTLDHEKDCSFILQQCENVLCENFIIRKSDEDLDTQLLCSEGCENLIKFSVCINEEAPFETLEAFKGLMDRCKRLAENQVKDEMSQKIRRIEEMRRGTEAFCRVKERIRREIEVRKNYFHCGLWNVRSLKWTCCKNTEIESIGCKQVGEIGL